MTDGVASDIPTDTELLALKPGALVDGSESEAVGEESLLATTVPPGLVEGEPEEMMEESLETQTKPDEPTVEPEPTPVSGPIVGAITTPTSLLSFGSLAGLGAIGGISYIGEQAFGGGGSASPVPEPVTLIALTPAAIVMIRRRIVKRS